MWVACSRVDRRAIVGAGTVGDMKSGGEMPLDRDIARALRASVSIAESGSAASRIPPVSKLDGLTRAAAYHGVVGYVHETFEHTDLLPVAEQARIATFRERTVQAHLRVMADLSHLRAVLDAAGIPWLVMKGPTLALPVHGRVEMRSYGDLDVLVEPHRFGRAIEALEDGGCRLVDQNWTLFRDQLKGELELLLPAGTKLDLHWHLINERAVRDTFSIDIAGVIDRRRDVGVGADSVPTLSPEDTLVYVATHATLSGADRLIWLKDVERLVTLELASVTAVQTRARQWAANLPLAAAMTRAAAAMDGFAAGDPYLPRDLRSRAFLAVADVVWHRHPLESEDGDGSVPRMLARSVRARPSTSARVWLGKAIANVAGRYRRYPLTHEPDPSSPGSGRFPSGGPRVRQQFLAAVAASSPMRDADPRGAPPATTCSEPEDVPGGETPPAALRLRTEGVTWQALDDGLWMFDARTARHFRLNETGARLLSDLAAGATQDELVQCVISEFGADLQVAGRDVEAFLSMLEERDWLMPTSG